MCTESKGQETAIGQRRCGRLLRVWVMLISALAGWLFGTGPALAGTQPSAPEAVLKAYLGALYARDADAAHALLSTQDKAQKSLDVYRAEHGTFSGSALVLSRELAAAIRFGEMDVAINGDRATATFGVRLPDANAQALAPIVQNFDPAQLGEVDSDRLEQARLRLRQLARTDALPFIEGPNERWEMVREDGQWRVFINWAGAIEVFFDAVVQQELGWHFEPVRARVLAQPGQTIHMAYRARNTGASETTGKARHLVGPLAGKEHFEIISCFCFVEQTLAAGEQVEMPLTFRVDYEVPGDVTRFDVRYEFYSVADFPAVTR